MRLKSIKLAGFKSFVDPTRVEFPSTITAIVGPNGCGKSNTIDAVRWVMGEISAKQLRGESMADVIFNGSIHRAPVSQASIELQFDNTLGRLGGEYNSYNEITIRRQVSRDGQSNYYLNGSRCRRKDITDIFLGTGLGPRSYAIIEQGTISRLIEARPEELRVFLEEAAGISRYKERRKETEQRIEHTRDNLARLNDVREELNKQIAHLERQAKTAERYKQLKAEERALRAQLYVLRQQHLQAEYSQAQAQLEQLTQSIATQEATQAELNEQWELQFELQRTTQQQLEQAQQTASDINARIMVCQQNIQHHQHQKHQGEFELKQLLQEQRDAEHLSSLDSSNLEQLTHDLEVIQEALQVETQAFEARQEQHREASENQRKWQFEWQETNLALATASQTAQVEQTRIQQMETRLRQIQAELQKLSEEKSQLSTEEETKRLEEHQNERAALEEARSDLQEQIAQQETALRTFRDQHVTLNQTLNEARRQLQQFDGKLTALQTLQQQAQRRQQQSIQAWLKTHGFENAENLADLIKVEPGYEAYLEHYLGEKLQAVALNNFSHLNNLETRLPEGNLDFFTGGNTSVDSHLQAHGNGKLLANYVSGPAALMQKLAHVYCAANYDEAVHLITSLPENAEVITPDGLIVQKHWVQIRRGKDEQSGVLQRKRDIAELEATIEAQRNKLETLEAQQEQLQLDITTAEENRQSLQRNWQTLDQTWHQCHAQIQIQNSRIQQKQNRVLAIEQEMRTQSEERETLETQHASSLEIWQAALTELNRHSQLRDTLATNQDTVEADLAIASRNLREAQANLEQLRLKEQRYRTEKEGLLMQKERTSTQLQQLATRQKNLSSQLENLGPTLEHLENELAEQKEAQVIAERTLDEAKSAMTQIDALLRHIEAERQRLAQSLERVRAQNANYQVQAEHAQTKSSSILEQFQELDLVFDEVAANMPAEANEQEWQTQLEQTQQRIDRLGAINLAAISELDGQMERKQFIDKQFEDLTEALTTLEAAIREIDKETKTKFEETFNIVNTNFQALFPKIFGGGQAYLSLTSDDLLETGVVVFAQPPGKRNSSIHLLSGGEKALTALALVFGIFELNPAPFCMLDEVDAPLDDVNVGRFCNLVKAMAQKTQFIVVTHNKVAMEMADQLMGVTMQEPGVSRLVSVDIDSAIAMAAA
jgi:chromosome segregation protein